MTTATIYDVRFPNLPVPHSDFVQYVTENPSKSLLQLLEPFKQYDAELRRAFAQIPDHPAVSNPNILSIFTGAETNIKIRGRDLQHEDQRETESYIMPLKQEARKQNGSAAIVNSLAQFKEQFSLFSESALADMDWSNVVAAGSSVVTPLLPVPDKYNGSKRAMRQYYHEIFAPASDVDLFIYGLTEEQAIDKIRQIERKIKDALLTETTTIRTKNAITIASQYPTRHIQIVLRIYKSISEILTGFDVDCSCAAFDGKQVWTNPRALVAYMTQANAVDLTRRSPSYESRLSKYHHRGFEVYWPDLDRSRIDPTIFERSFLRTEGLARLLVLEKLPTNTARESYLDQRRQERGRPAINRNRRRAHKLVGNIKAEHDDEVAEWVDAEEVSDYHTFTIPYGPKYHAAKIEKLLFTKDLLLNAEWNKPKDREVHLHRHPAFFGDVDDVIHDCCGYCPKPTTMEEEEIYEKESKIYVSGDIQFIRDDPGRQTIGSFNPLSAEDYTEMAYIGNTQMLCRAIVEHDLEYVENWLDQEGNNPDTRDHTGRTPLHLAVMQSSLPIVQALINHGARLVARLVDGRTALHIACMLGRLDVVRALLIKSAANEEEEEAKIDARRQAHKAKNTQHIARDSSNEDDDIDMLDDASTDVDATTENSIVNIKSLSLDATDKALDEEGKNEPDIYDVNVLAWDTALSPLHLAIIQGHAEIVKFLVEEYGADVLLPVKLFQSYDPTVPRGALLTLVLALELPLEKAKLMSRTLFDLGATCSQADIDHRTALQTCVAEAPALLDTYLGSDTNGVKRALNHYATSGGRWDPRVESALMTAIEARDSHTALKLLGLGAKSVVSYDSYVKAIRPLMQEVVSSHYYAQDHKRQYEEQVEQPVVLAVNQELPEIAIALIRDYGADVNTLTKQGSQVLRNEHCRSYTRGTSLLDIVVEKLKALREWSPDTQEEQAPTPLNNDAEYLDKYVVGTYRRWQAEKQLKSAKETYQQRWDAYVQNKKRRQEAKGVEEKQAAIFDMIDKFKALEAVLRKQDAKTFHQLHPKIDESPEGTYNTNYRRHLQYSKRNESSPILEDIKFQFALPALSDDYVEQYVEMFEAAWSGDVENFKKHALVPWTDSDGQQQTPLKAAVKDMSGLSPYSIAVVRGHHELATIILELAKAQHAVQEKPKQITRIKGEGDEDYDDSEDEEDGSDIGLHTETIHDKFTVEDVGAVSVQVRNPVTVNEMLSWGSHLFTEIDPVGNQDGYKEISNKRTHTGSIKDLKHMVNTPVEVLDKPTTLIQWALWRNDDRALALVLDACTEHFTARSDDDHASVAYTLPATDFFYALQADRPEVLALLMRKTAAGLPLNQFVKKSGIEITEKPVYYQGLSVHGKKKKEWATRGRNDNHRRSIIEHLRPPMLEATRIAALENVEWLSSDAPLRCYKHYAETHPDDKRITHLQQLKGGFEGMVDKFLTTRNELALHSCLFAKPSPASCELLHHLIKEMPHSINLKSEEGITPLHIAFHLRREAEAKALISAGADLTVRDKKGRNVLHLLFEQRYYHFSGDKDEERAKDLTLRERMIKLVDNTLHDTLFLERTTAAQGTRTPLALWLSKVGNEGAEAKMLQLILKYSHGKELYLVDGEGNTPLHTVLGKNFEVFKALIEHDAHLINRENATGRTTYEICRDEILSEYFRDPPSLSRFAYYGNRRMHGERWRHGNQSILDLESERFLTKKASSKEVSNDWQLLQDTMTKLVESNQLKRVLVTVNEANEVARRLAAAHAECEEQTYRQAHNARQERYITCDEVAAWMSIASPSRLDSYGWL